MLNGRIIKGIGGLYFVQTSLGLYECSCKGIFRNRKILPVIGDLCQIDVINDQQNKGNIVDIKPRNNELIRPRVANIDQALVIFASKDPIINLDLLDRFIITIESKNIELVICINKIDLENKETVTKIRDIYGGIGYKVLFTSVMDKSTMSDFYGLLQGKVTAIAGPSGVGKSSIVNILTQKATMETGELSKKISRGKHTTRHVELISINEETYIVDTPGFTSLLLDNIDTEKLADYFIEFAPFKGKCRFLDCKHLHEPDCAVKQSIGKTVSQERYDSYCRLLKEID